MPGYPCGGCDVLTCDDLKPLMRTLDAEVEIISPSFPNGCCVSLTPAVATWNGSMSDPITWEYDGSVCGIDFHWRIYSNCNSFGYVFFADLYADDDPLLPFSSRWARWLGGFFPTAGFTTGAWHTMTPDGWPAENGTCKPNDGPPNARVRLF